MSRIQPVEGRTGIHSRDLESEGGSETPSPRGGSTQRDSNDSSNSEVTSDNKSETSKDRGVGSETSSNEPSL